MRLLAALLVWAVSKAGRAAPSVIAGLDTVDVEDPPETDRAAAEGGDESAADRRLRLGFSVAISVGAVALATAHLVWPDAKLDSVTLVLLAIALLPWLGAIFKTVKLPWIEVEYWKQLQVVKARTDELHSRLAAVETTVFRFTGATPSQETRLGESLGVYAKYLEDLGFPWDRDDLPEVAVERLPWEGIPGIYDSATNRIVLAPDAVDVTIALRQYTHWVLNAHVDRSGGLQRFRKAGGFRMMEIEDGLADYFPASHLNDPVLGRHAAQRHGASFYRDLADPVAFDRLPSPLPSANRPEAGTAWGSLFWAIRDLVGQEETDAILAESWIRASASEGGDRRFVTELLDRVPHQARSAVNDLLQKRCVAQ